MGHFQPIATASDRVMNALVSGLELEFGRGAAEGLAKRFMEAEECEFCWDARTEERWLSAYETLDVEDLELDRVAIIGQLDGAWIVAVCIVDGDGTPHGMTGKRSFGTERSAQAAFKRVH